MTFARALVYFLREAATNLKRSFKVSLVAVLTIGVSLFVGGSFLMISNNLAQLVEQWRSDTKIVVYLSEQASFEELEALRKKIAESPFSSAVQVVTEELARQRFVSLFPGFDDLVQGSALPPSLEIAFDSQAAATPAFSAWLEELRQQPQVAIVDDERQWLGQLATLVGVGRALGFGLGLILFVGAVFTIASVVRLTAYLYHDEIAIMRLVGATEFFIRGPFYAEGMLQGLLGGSIAALGLTVAFHALAARAASSTWASLALGRFLEPWELLGLVLVGALGGLAGAILSLRREKLAPVEP